MDALSFAFGALAMFAIAITIIAVVGVVKVTKLEKRVDAIKNDYDDKIVNLWNDIDKKECRVNDNLGELHRKIDEGYKDLYDRIEKSVFLLTKDLTAEINQSVEKAKSYVDSRYDKTHLGTSK